MQRKSVRSTKGQLALSDWHLQIANSACVDHTIGQWRRLGAGMQRLASAVPQLQHQCGRAYWQTKAFQTSRLSPNSHLFPNKPTTCGSTVRKVWAVRATRAGAGKLFERIVRWRRDMRGPVPYRTRGTVARPASGHSCTPTSSQWRTRRTAFFLPHTPVVSAAACNSAGAGLAWLAAARDMSTLSTPGPAVSVFEI